jgi:hypothetical protein
VEPGISLRMSIYRRPEARRLLSMLLEEGRVYAPGSGADDVLGDMLRLGMLREAARESWLRDPTSGATSFSLRPSCPYCGSSDIEKEELMEHIGCGYVGRASDFLRGGECKVCPRCGRPADLRVIGSWFYCRSCGRSFQSPRIIASSGDRMVRVEELEPVVVTRYEVNPAMREEVRGVLSLYSRLEDRLRSLGYSIEESASVTGASGVPQKFDLIARAQDHSVYADFILAESEPLLLAGMMGQLVKYFDVVHGSRLLLVLVPMSDLPQRLLGSCCPGMIRILGGGTPEEAAGAIEGLEL